MKKLCELTNQELEELYNSNNYLKKTIFDFACENTNFEISELLDYFRGIRALDYEIGYHGDYFTFNTYRANNEDYRAFFDAICDIENCFCCLLSDKTRPIFDRISEKLDFYIDCIEGYEDISDKNFNRLESWIDAGIKEICNDILRYCDCINDQVFDNEYINEELYSICKDGYLSDYTTENGLIYEPALRCFN